MSKTLIFDATGNLGGLTAALLHESAADSLRVSTSREAGLSRLAKRFPDAEAVVCDWNDEESVVAALNGVSRLLVVPPAMPTDENVVTPNIINAARKAGTVEQIVRMLGIPHGLTLDQVSQDYSTPSVAPGCTSSPNITSTPAACHGAARAGMQGHEENRMEAEGAQNSAMGLGRRHPCGHLGARDVVQDGSSGGQCASGFRAVGVGVSLTDAEQGLRTAVEDGALGDAALCQRFWRTRARFAENGVE